MYDVVIIASMIEREVLVPKERPLVAAVIYNRLSQGMPLGIDATLRYDLDNFDEPLTESDLATDSPYNTRLVTGLPPTPIANPGLDSLKAAADPAERRLHLLRRQARHLRRALLHQRLRRVPRRLRQVQLGPRGRGRLADRLLRSASRHTDAMNRLAVVGHPVAHSLSPAMHTAAFAALGLGDEWSYEAIDLAPERVRGAGSTSCAERGLRRRQRHRPAQAGGLRARRRALGRRRGDRRRQHADLRRRADPGRQHRRQRADRRAARRLRPRRRRRRSCSAPAARRARSPGRSTGPAPR